MRFSFRRFRPLLALPLFALACGLPAVGTMPVAELAANDAPPPAAIPAPVAPANPVAPEAEPPVWSIPPNELEPQTILRAMETAGPDWGVIFLNAPEAWKKTKGKGVVVAVLDTGVDSNHPDLKEAVKAVKDFSGSPFGATDKQGHGTHCAGSVLARGDLPGVAPEADLLGVKVLGDNGSGSVVAIANGIKWATDEGADVISMSLGGPGADNYIPPALKYATDAGVIVIAAAGNSGPREGTVDYPGKYPECLAIAACDKDRNIANFSSRGPAVFCTGPGVNVRSTYPGGQYATMSGTSMATPNIAGVAALWVASHPEVAKKDRPAKFREELIKACNHAERNTSRGYGVPNAVKLVTVGGVIPPDPPQPGKPFALSITFADLSAVKQAELKAAGVNSLLLTVGGTAPQPMPPPVAPAPPAPVVPVQPGQCFRLPDGSTWCPQQQQYYQPSGWYPGKFLGR